TLRACFIQHPKKPNCLTHERLLAERKKQKEWKKKCAVGGVKSGQVRRARDKSSDDNNSESKGSSRVVEVNTNSSSSSSSSSSFPSSSSKKRGESQRELALSDTSYLVDHSRTRARPATVAERFSGTCEELWQIREADPKRAQKIMNSLKQ